LLTHVVSYVNKKILSYLLETGLRFCNALQYTAWYAPSVKVEEVNPCFSSLYGYVTYASKVTKDTDKILDPDPGYI
jgi:hypothetical protein